MILTRSSNLPLSLLHLSSSFSCLPLKSCVAEIRIPRLAEYWKQLAEMTTVDYDQHCPAPQITAFARCQYVHTRTKRRSHRAQLSVDTEHRGYYEPITTNTGSNTIRPSISLSEALLYGLYKGVDCGFLDPLSGKTLSLQDALDCQFIDINRSHLITSSDGPRQTLSSALSTGILDAQRNCVINPDTLQAISLDDVRVGDELSLVDAVAEGLLCDGEIVDCQSGLRFSLRYSVDHCLLSRSEQCGITITSTGQTMSLVQALDQNVINQYGMYVHRPTELTCTIKQAVNQGE